MGESVVRVASTTTRKFAPDVARLSVTIEGEGEAREACTAEFNARYEAVCRALVGAGVAAEAITTEHFGVHMRQQALYLPYEGGGGYYYCKQVADGYEYRGQLAVQLAADAELVGCVWVALNGVGEGGEGVTFDISYDLASPDAARDSLMETAVHEALVKARVLAAGAGLAVGKVREINFGTDFSHVSMPREYGVRAAKMMFCEDACADAAPSLEPREIEISCEVQLVCELV